MTTKDYIQKLRKEAKAEAKKVHSERKIIERRKYKKEGDKPDDGHNGASFLYIKAVNGDLGSRPIPDGLVFWNSPDIELYDSGGVQLTTNQIDAAESYSVKVVVTNDGDADCYSTQVELYIGDPSVGFSINTATLLGTQMVTVPAFSNVTVHFPFVAEDSLVGHRCMFARVFCFTTNDLPTDWINFKAKNDRHIGQQNLNIVEQESMVQVQVFVEELVNKNLIVYFEPNPKLIESLHFAFLGKYSVAVRKVTPANIQIARIEKQAVKTNAANERILRTEPARSTTWFTQPIISPAMNVETLKRIKIPKKNQWDFLPKQSVETLQIKIPKMRLKKNQVIPMDLFIKNPITNEVIGGVTYLVVG